MKFCDLSASTDHSEEDKPSHSLTGEQDRKTYKVLGCMTGCTSGHLWPNSWYGCTHTSALLSSCFLSSNPFLFTVIQHHHCWQLTEPTVLFSSETYHFDGSTVLLLLPLKVFGLNSSSVRSDCHKYTCSVFFNQSTIAQWRFLHDVSIYIEDWQWSIAAL